MTPKRKRATKAAPPPPVSLDIDASPPELWRVIFSRNPDEDPPEEEVTFRANFSLGFGRNHARHLGVELTMVLQDLPWLVKNSLVVTYRMFFIVRGPCSDEQLDATLHALGTRVGPATMYPFIRETISSVTTKTGSPIMVPLVSWEEVFPSVSIPPTDEPAPPEFLERAPKNESPGRD